MSFKNGHPFAPNPAEVSQMKHSCEKKPIPNPGNTEPESEQTRAAGAGTTLGGAAGVSAGATNINRRQIPHAGG